MGLLPKNGHILTKEVIEEIGQLLERITELLGGKREKVSFGFSLDKKVVDFLTTQWTLVFKSHDLKKDTANG